MKKLKKAISIMLLFVLIAGAYGCGSKSPSNVVKTYLEEVKQGKNGDFTELLDNSLDSAEKTNKSNIKESKLSDESAKKITDAMGKLTYTINSEKIDGDSAIVNVKVNGPDMSKVLGEFMQKAISAAFSKAFSGDKMSEEENNKLAEDILSDCLDNITNTERTGDISLKKSNGEWKINNDDSLKKLLLGIDGSIFSGQNSSDTNTTKEIKEMTLNEPFAVETKSGNYTLTIEGAKVTDKRNQFSNKDVKKVVFLNYSYANESFGKTTGTDLLINQSAFQVLDDEGNVLDTYPAFDDNRNAKDTPMGGKCSGAVAYALTTDSSNLNVTFIRNGSEKIAKIKVPIN
ncbi:DUF5105 domain-containing protein [Clostridium saccharobutylicum]|uniref:Lumazine-binding domain protein n=1 Tax=Clostridium saccharobutylicum TaxID=169679 RepID=A0A1S8NDW1_CLOSA|nr:DUF5105 domain-containing protein [Clostridium saccharobutylicum]OOM05847.1 lumazine-binding domain protein [Clostridium saccharobutylicum]OOM14461.1 lumazine-binding domain protein [Clostridium saccharobutylicum]